MGLSFMGKPMTKNSSYRYSFLDLLGDKLNNTYLMEARFTRESDLDNTSSIRATMESKFERYGRYHSSSKHLFGHSIIHVSDFEEFWQPIAFNPEYEGVFFLSNVANGTEIYIKLTRRGGFLGPYPWFRGAITLPIDKLMEVGDEMVSYPKTNQAVRQFLDYFDQRRTEGSIYGARYGTSPEFDKRMQARYSPVQYTRDFSTWDGEIDLGMVRRK